MSIKDSDILEWATMYCLENSDIAKIHGYDDDAAMWKYREHELARRHANLKMEDAIPYGYED